MSTIPPVSALAQRLGDLASMANGAAKLSGDYLNPPASHFEVRVTNRTNTLLRGIEQVKSEHAGFLDTPAGFDAHFDLNGAAQDVRTGLQHLRSGVVVEDDVLRSGDTVIRDETAAGTAARYFDSASRRLAAAAEGLSPWALDDAELMAKLLGPAN